METQQQPTATSVGTGILSVNEETKKLIDQALSPVMASIEELRSSINSRRDEHEIERIEIADDISEIRKYVEQIKSQRDKEIADLRHNVTDVDAKIGASINSATATFASALASAISPLTLEMATISGQVRIRLSDRDEGQQRHERELEVLRTNFRNIEQHILHHMEYIADIRRTLHGDANAKDNAPSVFGALQKIENLIIHNDQSLRKHIHEEGVLTETRMIAIERRLTPLEEYINRQVKSDIERAERRRKFKEAAFSVVKNSPMWVKIAATIGGGSGLFLVFYEFVRQQLGL